MATSKERIFVVGATGDIGKDVVHGLIRKGVYTTAYVRNESKAKALFKDELLSGYLTLVIGTYSSVEVYAKAIDGHTRLFLLCAVDFKKPTAMSEVKETFGRIAYNKGIRQIVDVSSYSAGQCGKQGIFGYMHRKSEQKLWNLTDERPDERSLVILRPAIFMNNQFLNNFQSIRNLNKLVSAGPSSSKFAWIDTKDISDCSVVILTEPVEKHDRYVYEMGAEFLTNEQRATIFSKVLGRTITYEQQPLETYYKTLLDAGIHHTFIYDMISISMESSFGDVTPQLSLLINRPLRTFEEWLQENLKIFQ